MLTLKLLLLILVANGAPILARRYLRERYAWPVDGGLRLNDGMPLLGAAKTWRGIVASVLSTALLALLFGLPLAFGILLAVMAMLGDLTSSFIKRRLGKAESAAVTGLDQIPESLLPALAGCYWLGYAWPLAIVITALFFVVDRWLSPLLFNLGVRQQPH
jgi:CDP-2,3-bis-(O-geranylgeranyl)-sn-glycerol synthase